MHQKCLICTTRSLVKTESKATVGLDVQYAKKVFDFESTKFAF